MFSDKRDIDTCVSVDEADVSVIKHKRNQKPGLQILVLRRHSRRGAGQMKKEM